MVKKSQGKHSRNGEMKDKNLKGADKADSGYSRRDFLRISRNAVVGAGVAGVASGLIWLDGAVAAVPVSGGYLLVDTKKCQGCLSCMLACSLVHEGEENLSLARIQIIQNPFESFPDDLTIEQCRQCVDPACVTACPTKALTVDAERGNVRLVDKTKCIGCGACVQACPYMPSRPVMAPDDEFGGALKSRKCDLCAEAPYHWDEAGGGINGKQACVEVCPVKAIKFTREIPVQEGDGGYKVNLRDRTWLRLGYPVL